MTVLKGRPSYIELRYSYTFMKNLEKSLMVCWELPPKISLFLDISRGFLKDMVDSSIIILVALVYRTCIMKSLNVPTLVY